MDILHLIDRLEELFNESRPIWFTHSVVMDEDRLLDLIDQMRIAIPEGGHNAADPTALRHRKKPTVPLPWPAKKRTRWQRKTRSPRLPRSVLNRSLPRRAKNVSR